VRAGVENLQLLKQEFMEFIEYRDLERHNLEAFHGDRAKEEQYKVAAWGWGGGAKIQHSNIIN
jgi:hypothetical protein